MKYRNHELVDQFVSYVNPERPIPDRITSLTGITNYRVSDAPTIEEVLPLFLAFYIQMLLWPIMLLLICAFEK